MGGAGADVVEVVGAPVVEGPVPLGEPTVVDVVAAGRVVEGGTVVVGTLGRVVVGTGAGTGT